MTDTQRNANTVGAVTAAHDFDQITFEGEKLFSVREGVPLSDAFDKLEQLLTASRDNLCALTDVQEGEALTGALLASIHLLSLSCELVESMQFGHRTAVNKERAL